MNEIPSDAIALSDLPRLLPGRFTKGTILRWTRHGVAGVRLASFKLGGKRFVTREAIADFIAATSNEDENLNPETFAKRNRRKKNC